MATGFPASIDAYTNPTASDALDSVSVPHATQHANLNDAMEAVQAELGVNPAGTAADVAARLLAIEAALPGVPVIAEVEYTDTATLALTDAGKIVRANKATAMDIEVPPDADVAFPVGTTILVVQAGAGQVTIKAGSGVTLRSSGGALKTAAQYDQASLIKRATNEWYVAGGLTV